MGDIGKKYNKVVDLGIDANASSTTTALSTNGYKNIGVFVKGNSGTHATHVVTVQIFDGANWWDTTHTISQEGFFDNELCVCEKIRCKVTTVEGAASTIDVTIIAE